jgi:hypothetical protein
LTPAQERVVIEALLSHPTPLRLPAARVAAALVAAGVFRRGAGVEPSFSLTPRGLDVAARLSAQSVIDAVNARRAAGVRAATRRAPMPPDAHTGSERVSSKPADWPFPVSGHAW